MNMAGSKKLTCKETARAPTQHVNHSGASSRQLGIEGSTQSWITAKAGWDKKLRPESEWRETSRWKQMLVEVLNRACSRDRNRAGQVNHQRCLRHAAYNVLTKKKSIWRKNLGHPNWPYGMSTCSWSRWGVAKPRYVNDECIIMCST